jgi:putative NADH-flavin reductase
MVINRSVPSITRRCNALWRHLRIALQRLFVAAFAGLLLACTSQAPVQEVLPVEASGERHTIALLGATGMVGDYLLQEALDRGHDVRALARNPAKLAHYGSRITVIEGDARDAAVVSALLEGADVVVSALGPVKADGAAARTVNLDATRSVVQAMHQHGIARYVVVSGAAIVMPGDERDLLGWWIRTLARIGLPDAVVDKQAEYEFLAQSSVEWTLVRCPLIDPEPFRQNALVSLQTPPAFRVRAGELAHFVLNEVDARQYVRQGPFVGSRQTQVEVVASHQD